MCVNRLSWEASDGKKREDRHSSTPDFEKCHYFSTLRNYQIAAPIVVRWACPLDLLSSCDSARLLDTALHR